MNPCPSKFFVALCLYCLPISAQAQDPVHLLLAKASELQFAKPDSAYKLVNMAYQEVQKSANEELKAAIYLQFGDILYQQGTFARAFDYYLQAKSTYESMNSLHGIADAQLRLGKVKYYLKRQSEGFMDLQQAKKTYEKLNELEQLAETLGAMGHLFEKDEQLDSAQFYQKRALTLYEMLNDQAGIAHILENLGSISEDLEDFAAAQIYFEKAHDINDGLNNRVELVSNLNNIGDVYRKTGQLDSALHYTNLALQLASDLELDYQKSSALRDLGKCYQAMGQFEQALDYKEQSRELFEVIYSQESSRQMALLQTLYDVERKNAEIKALESEKRADTIFKQAAFATAGLLLLLIVVLINRHRLKSKKNQLIIDQQKRLHASDLENVKLNEERLRIELENKQLQEKQLNMEIQSQQKSLGARMLQLIEKNKLLEEVRDGISEVKSALPEVSQQRVNQVVKEINYSFNHDKEWEEFRRSFEQIHKEFFDQLRQINKELTSNDLRICALIKINLRSKEIAQLLSISNDSLRVARYRLRKKLQLNQGENLRNFLLNI